MPHLKPLSLRLLPLLILAFSLQPSAFSAQIVTATLSLTNAPTTNGMKLIVNGDTRDFTNTVVTPATQVLTNSTIGGSTTNLYNQISLYSFTGPLTVQLTATNEIKLTGTVDQSLTVTNVGPWVTITLSTQVVAGAIPLRLPLTVATAAVQTNQASLLISNIFNLGLSTNKILATAPVMDNFVDVSSAESITGAKTFSGATTLTNDAQIIYGGQATNQFRLGYVVMPYGGTNAGLYFSRASDGQYTYGLRPDSSGFPSLYLVVTNTVTLENKLRDGSEANFAPGAGNILSREIGDYRYGQLAAGNTWSGSNTFRGQNNFHLLHRTNNNGIYFWDTNSASIQSVIAPNAGGYPSLYAATTEADDYITLGALNVTAADANILNRKSANNSYGQLAAGNTWLGTNSFKQLRFTRGTHSSLANGNNAGVNFGTNTFVKIIAGPTAAYALCGITNGADGVFLVLYSSVGQSVTLANESGVEATPANRILTLTGTNVTINGNCVLTLIYDSAASRWILASFVNEVDIGSILTAGLPLETQLSRRISDWRRNNYNLAAALNIGYANENKENVTLSETAAGDNKCHTLLFANGYLVAATMGSGSAPANLMRFNDLNNLTNYTAITWPNDGYHQFSYDAVYSTTKARLYQAFGKVGGALTIEEINLDTMATSQVVQEISAPFYQNWSVCTDETNLFFVTYTSPSQIIKYSLTDWSKTTMVLTNQNLGHAIRFDGTRLYATGASSPGWIAKINPSTLAWSAQNFATGDDTATDDFVLVGDWAFVGLEATTGIVLRIAKNDLSNIDRIYTGVAAASYGISFFDGRSVWVQYNTTPGQMIRIDPTTLQTSEFILATGENKPNELATDGQRLFITTWTDPVQVIRLSVPNLDAGAIAYVNTSGQRKLLLAADGATTLQNLATDLGAGGAKTLTATNATWIVNASSATITLPTAIGSNGRLYTIKNYTAITNTTVTNALAQTIDGATSYTITNALDAITLQSDNTNWWILQRFP